MNRQKRQFDRLKKRARKKSNKKKSERLNTISRIRTRKNRLEKMEYFNEKHKEKGGIGKLIEMKNDNRTQDSIAEHFGIVKERVRQVMAEFFDESYDPRPQRRQNRVDKMVKYISKHGLDKFKEKYKEENRLYKKLALEQYDSERHKD